MASMTKVSPVTSRDAWVELDEGRIFTRRWEPRETSENPGSGCPLVLFHDSLGCVELWRDFPARLCERTGMPVIAYDRLGFGRSDPHPGQLRRDFIAEEARSTIPLICRRHGVEQFAAFGHSVGGGMAIHCAAAPGLGCLAVVTESAQAFVEDRTTAGIREAKSGFAASGQLDRLERYHGEKHRWVLNAWTETWLDPGFASWSLDEVLTRVSCPVLAIHGELDEYGSVEQPERIAARADGPVHVQVLDGVHHVPHREDPELVLNHVAPFFASTLDRRNGGRVK